MQPYSPEESVAILRSSESFIQNSRLAQQTWQNGQKHKEDTRSTEILKFLMVLMLFAFRYWCLCPVPDLLGKSSLQHPYILRRGCLRSRQCVHQAVDRE